jgi:xeroderma pigmentosum group C-complementing protein
MAGGFFLASQEEPEHGDLTIDHGEKDPGMRTTVAETSYQTPISLTSALQQPVDEASDASRAAEDMEIDDAEHSEEAMPPKPPPRRKSAASQPSRGRARGRAGKATPASARKRKSILADSSDEDDDEPSRSVPASDPPTPSPSTRSAPKRKAARRSDAQVKSHFFAEGSEGETDLTDLTDRASPRKKKAGRGRGKAKG